MNGAYHGNPRFPRGVPKGFHDPSHGRPIPKPPAGRNKEGRKGKRGSPQKRKRNENEKSTEKKHSIATDKAGNWPLATRVCRVGGKVARRLRQKMDRPAAKKCSGPRSIFEPRGPPVFDRGLADFLIKVMVDFWSRSWSNFESRSGSKSFQGPGPKVSHRPAPN